MTVHNMAYQGLFWHEDMDLTGLPWELFNWRMLEYYGKLSFLKAGLVAADAVTTVSEHYAEEIKTPEFGMGLEGVISERADVLHGIVNGVDYGVWSPEVDALLPSRYSADDLRGKHECKQALQEHFGLPVRADAPLIGMIGRLAEQKGLDLLAQGLDDLLSGDVQIVILGTGQPDYHDLLERMAGAHPSRIGVFLGFDEALAHLIEAGCDMFLMPSRFEPCGLNQLYSLRYGTVPIVSRTGGLADTITDYSEETSVAGTATGFTFAKGSVPDMLGAIERARRLYLHEPETWRQLQLRGMAQDWSWERSAREYRALYAEVAQRAKGA
jgi:starch synthase